MTEYHPIITQTALIINLHKPIFDSRFGIWDRWLKIAKQKNLNIIANTPFGKATYTYKEYMNGAIKGKRFYKNPNEPMIFYMRDFLPDIKARIDRKKKEEKESQSLTKNGASKLLSAYRDMLKAKKSTIHLTNKE